MATHRQVVGRGCETKTPICTTEFVLRTVQPVLIVLNLTEQSCDIAGLVMDVTNR